MEKWREAVKNSEAINQLKKLLAGPSTITIGSRSYGVSKKHVRYLLGEHEIWARSYAQYISTKGENTVLKAQLQSLVDQRKHAAADYASQWRDDDFKPIAEAIDEVFIEMGWING